MYKWFLLLTLFLAGCASSRHIDSFENLNTTDISCYQNSSEFIRNFFTAEAASAVKDIPIIRGPAPLPYVSGVNFWSSFISTITLQGWGRKIILPLDSIYDKYLENTLIHEYIHHLDDMDRDGEGDFIDHRAFELAYLRFKSDPRFKQKSSGIEKRADRLITNIFGIGPMSEQIAYTGAWVATSKEPPEYLIKVFEKMLKRNHDSVQANKSE